LKIFFIILVGEQKKRYVFIVTDYNQSSFYISDDDDITSVFLTVSK